MLGDKLAFSLTFANWQQSSPPIAAKIAARIAANQPHGGGWRWLDSRCWTPAPPSLRSGKPPSNPGRRPPRAGESPAAPPGGTPRVGAPRRRGCMVGGSKRAGPWRPSYHVASVRPPNSATEPLCSAVWRQGHWGTEPGHGAEAGRAGSLRGAYTVCSVSRSLKSMPSGGTARWTVRPLSVPAGGGGVAAPDQLATATGAVSRASSAVIASSTVRRLAEVLMLASR